MDLRNATQNIHRDVLENDEDEISNTERYITMAFLAFLSVMGTTGNALVLYVFSKKKDRLVSTLFILILAFVDFTTCLFVIPYTIFMEYIRFYVRYDILCKIYQFLITSNIPFSALIMVAIAIDRYFCICHPFFHGLNLQRAKYVTAGLGLFAVGLGVVVALMYGVYHNDVGVSDVTVTSILSNFNGDNTTIYSGINNTSYNYETGDIGTVNVATVVAHVNDSRSHMYNVNSDEPVPNNNDIYYYTGKCEPTDKIFNQNFQWYYQKFYYALFVLCLVIVIVLYTLIYRSVLKRRSKRQKQKSKSLPLIQNDTITHTSPETMLTVVNGDGFSGDSENPMNISPTDESRPALLRPPSKNVQKGRKNSLKKAQKQKTAKKDRIRMANLKTAAMLFVVTLVFVVTFLPAFLMALMIVPYNIVVFYLYFANNVANPVIYSFMNKNFRDDLKRLFCRKR